MTAAQAAAMAYNAALRLNPQCVTFLQRTSASAPGDSDTFTAYQLGRATYEEVGHDEATTGGVTLADNEKQWTLYKLDLLNAGVPSPISPQLTYAIGDHQYGDRSGTLTSSNTVVTNISTSGLGYGMAVIGEGIPDFTQIASVSSDSITLNKAATADGATSLTFGLWWIVAKSRALMMDAAYVCTCTQAR